MHGNAWEWCLDSYWPNYGAGTAYGGLINPAMIVDDESYPNYRVTRGGSFTERSYHARSASREYYGKTRADRDFGIRLVLVRE